MTRKPRVRVYYKGGNKVYTDIEINRKAQNAKGRRMVYISKSKSKLGDAVARQIFLKKFV